MIFNRKDELEHKLKTELQEYIYDIVGVIHDVYKELPNGLPEYIYQEALERAFADAHIKPEKEFRHHPIFRGKPLDSYLKMDFMIPRSRGNIIIECKAIDKLTSHEYQQLFSYMVGTGFPIGIIVNFHSYPKILLHKFYFDKKDNTITSF